MRLYMPYTAEAFELRSNLIFAQISLQMLTNVLLAWTIAAITHIVITRLGAFRVLVTLDIVETA